MGYIGYGVYADIEHIWLATTIYRGERWGRSNKKLQQLNSIENRESKRGLEGAVLATQYIEESCCDSRIRSCARQLVHKKIDRLGKGRRAKASSSI